MINALCKRLTDSAERLTAIVLTEMYDGDPFWRDRYGGRADHHGKQDGQFHIQYLCEALASGEASVMTRYAQWLQQVLTTRGMCSRHLGDNFDLLARAIEREGWPDAMPALDMLGLASEALHHADPGACAIQAAAQAIGSRGASDLPGTPGFDATGELSYLADYLADAIALAMPAIVHKRAAWAEGFHAKHGRAVTVAGLLTALRHAAISEAPDHRAAIERALADPAA